jgi:hypothetical protein
MPEMRPDIERAINRIVEIIADAAAQSGMSKDDANDLKEALGQLVAAVKR